MRTTAAVPAVLLALLAAPAARAQPVSEPSGPDTYLEFQLGGFVPGSDLDPLVDPGVALAGTFGARFSRYVGAEGSVGYYHAGATTTLAGSSFQVASSLNVVPILASLRFTAPLDALELSARAGVGIHLASLHAEEAGGFSTFDSATAFGWHVGGSTMFKLSPTMLVGVDALATFASASFGGVDRAIDGLQISVKLGYRL
jgi:opacity protein-like surface antigen